MKIIFQHPMMEEGVRGYSWGWGSSTFAGASVRGPIGFLPQLHAMNTNLREKLPTFRRESQQGKTTFIL